MIFLYHKIFFAWVTSKKMKQRETFQSTVMNADIFCSFLVGCVPPIFIMDAHSLVFDRGCAITIVMLRFAHHFSRDLLPFRLFITVKMAVKS